MQSSSMEMITAIKQHLKQSFSFIGKTVDEIRSEETAALNALPKPSGVVTEQVTIGNMKAEWVRSEHVPEGDSETILYFHGGAFISGSCDTHRDLVARISRFANTKVLVIEYRLAPEHRYPAANEDCLEAYRWLIDKGISNKKIILGGDSVGGCLALMTLLTLRDKGDPLPAGAFCLSPHTDFLHFDSESYITRSEFDPLGSLASSRLCADYYLGSIMPKPEIMSPLYQNLHGLPPLFIQVGDHEVLLDECVRFADKAKAAGVDVTLEKWEHMWCVFQQLAGILPEGEQALEHIGLFVKSGLQGAK
ncbi:alpha/beta hydrolase [Paenibacillus sp. UNC451MF]|uniref:alpha/beta hydrolase n=1 Tax=Paenibacillus sp. UNC451MF TaxID=1449063 RepID=UPI00056B3012|nr:alpha/beta hydrolase [Paenibacillus sp. UNC451MF]